MAQILPPFVHEAYTLLKSSIIHVEQDDIDFDDPDLEMDLDAAAAATDAAEAADQSSSLAANETNTDSLAMPSSPTPGQSASTPAQLASTPQPQAQPQPKRKMRITHDKYTTMQELLVLHVASVEQATGTGIEGSDLADWYLESKEDEFGSMEEMEEERELLGKVLKKLVKVRFSFSFSRGRAADYYFLV